MEDKDKLSEIKDRAEMIQIAETMAALQYQMKYPTYEGMLAALQNAQYLASLEIQGAINQSGGQACNKPWAEFTPGELYHMLPAYMEGLNRHGTKKCGEQLFKNILSENGL